MEFPSVTRVESRDKYRIHLTYADGTEGVLDLGHLAHQGVFKRWEQDDFFDRVHLDSETGAITWDDSLDICPDSAFLRLKGLTFAEWKSLEPRYAHD